MTNIRNLVIIGSGPAAWTAAIYAARAKLNPLVIAGEQNGGQLMNTTLVENFPGFPDGIMGPELMINMRKQAERLGTEIVNKNVEKLYILPQHYAPHSRGLRPRVMASQARGSDVPADFSNEKSGFVRKKLNEFRLEVSDKSTISAKSVIISTGANANTLKLPGEKELMGRGVGVCAVCDAPFYKDTERVFVIGGGDSAIEEATALAKYAKEVVILVRKDKMRAAAVAIDNIKRINNIKIWYKSEAIELIGQKVLKNIKVIRENEQKTYSANGLFYAIGHTPATGWLKDSGVKMDDKGYIKTNLTTVLRASVIPSASSVILNPDVASGEGSSPDSNRDDTNIPIARGSLDSSTRRNSSLRMTNIPAPQNDGEFLTSTSVPGIFAAGDCVDAKYRQAVVAAGMGCMAALDTQSYLECGN